MGQKESTLGGTDGKGGGSWLSGHHHPKREEINKTFLLTSVKEGEVRRRSGNWAEVIDVPCQGEKKGKGWGGDQRAHVH